MRSVSTNKILILNHVFWPDQQNTARHISELASELVKRGWDVTASVGNRSYLNHRKKFFPMKGMWNGVSYIRIKTPPLDQKSNAQRLMTSLWLIFSWILKLPRLGKFDIIIIGTNPPFAYLLVPFLKMIKRKSKIILWGFDLYPEAIIASVSQTWKFAGKIIKPVTILCHKQLDILVDIGSCMRAIYRSYRHGAKEVTLTPWSFVEPSKISLPHPETRKLLFGDSKVTLLYSGTIGKAHEFENFFLLARELRRRKALVALCFAGLGNQFANIKRLVTSEDTNISFGDFVNSDEELTKRISAADFMLISLKESWTGISVPSKFFGAIASGKAIIFSGSEKSSLRELTEKYEFGYHLTRENITRTADQLSEIAENPEIMHRLQLNAFNAYKSFFSKEIICNKWDKILHEAINS